MIAWIACVALVVGDAPAPSPGSDDLRAAYNAQRAASGRSPDDQVRLAYWCETHGLDAERVRHLALAVLADPNHAAARGLLGLVSRDNRWLKPDAVADRVRADANLATILKDYNEKRSRAAYTADGQWEMAVWATDRGLADQARAHLNAVVRLDPKRDAAWRRLGYKKVDGRWTTDAELAANRLDADTQRAADQKWKPLLEKWRTQLGKPRERAEAEAGLLTVTDPRAVRWVAQVFLSGGKPHPAVALQVLAQIDSAASSRLITSIALNADDPNIRRAALETLRRRDPREFADLLIRRLRNKIDYEIQRVNGPGSTGRLVVKGTRQRIQRLYNTPAIPNYLAWLSDVADGAPTLTYHYQGLDVVGDRERPGDNQRIRSEAFAQLNPTDPALAAQVHQVQHDAPGAYHNLAEHNKALKIAEEINPVGYRYHTGIDVKTTRDILTPIQTDTTIPVAAMMAQYQTTALAAQQQMARDAAQIDSYNRDVMESNDRLTLILRTVSGVDKGTDIAAWSGWLVNLSGYAMTNDTSSDVVTYTVDVPLDYQPQAVPMGVTTYNNGSSVVQTNRQFTPFEDAHGTKGDCFGAGTLVRTITGSEPIESLHPGDLVLTQSTNTGALKYSPILVVHRNPPSPTFNVRVGGGAITSSPFHRFWKVGQGWVMARDLQVGDRLRLLNGTATIEELAEGQTQPVFNLDIADDADFFAGSGAVLVHDNSLIDPRLTPFDRVAEADKATLAKP